MTETQLRIEMSTRQYGRKTISYRPIQIPLRTSRYIARLCSDDTWSDFFCGAGGSSLGLTKRGRHNAKRRGTLVLAVNHWKLALETHNTNFPEAHHELADMSVEDPARYPHTRNAWFSPECKYQTLARGLPAPSRQQVLWTEWEPEADEQAERSRATMGDVIRFTRHHRYDYVVVENVVDVLRWPAFPSWWEAMTGELEYAGRKVSLNSMFCWPTPQSRDRLYCVFTRKGLPEPNLDITPPAWCPVCEHNVAAIQSWKTGRTAGKYRQQYLYCCPTCAREVIPYYYCAANAIDWTIPIERIGDRQRPLKDKTLERITRGLDRYGNQPLLLVANHRGDGNLHALIGHPLPTQTAQMTSAMALPLPPAHVAHVAHVVPLTRDDRSIGVQEPFPTQTGTLTRGLLLSGAPFLLAPGSGGLAQGAYENPLPTQITHAAPMVVVPWLIEVGHGGPDNSGRVKSTTDPLATQHSFGGMGLASYLVPLDHSGVSGKSAYPTGDPMHTQTSRREQGLVLAPFIVEMRGGGSSARPASEALATVTAGGNNHALVSVPAASGSQEPPRPQSHPYLVTYNGESGEPHSMTSIVRHGLAIPGERPRVEDCYFRTLKWHEVRAGMAFPPEYVIHGDSRAKIMQLGQAVTPPAAEVLADRIMATAG